MTTVLKLESHLQVVGSLEETRGLGLFGSPALVWMLGRGVLAIRRRLVHVRLSVYPGLSGFKLRQSIVPRELAHLSLVHGRLELVSLRLNGLLVHLLHSVHLRPHEELPCL